MAMDSPMQSRVNTSSGTFCAARPIQALEDPFEDDALDAMWHTMQNDIDSEGFAGLNLNHNIVVLDPVVRIHEGAAMPRIGGRTSLDN